MLFKKSHTMTATARNVSMRLVVKNTGLDGVHKPPLPYLSLLWHLRIIWMPPIQFMYV